MILINKAYAKVWKVDPRQNYTALNISTGDKQQDGSYKNSNWNARLVGKAKDITVNEGDRIEITSAKIENIWDKQNNRNWLNVIIFDFVVQDSDGGFKPIEEDEEELPF